MNFVIVHFVVPPCHFCVRMVENYRHGSVARVQATGVWLNFMSLLQKIDPNITSKIHYAIGPQIGAPYTLRPIEISYQNILKAFAGVDKF